MWTTIASVFGGALSKLMSSVAKYAPMIGAYIAGKKSAKSDVVENTLEAKNEADEAGQKVEDELRDKPTGDYIRDNDI